MIIVVASEVIYYLIKQHTHTKQQIEPTVYKA